MLNQGSQKRLTLTLIWLPIFTIIGLIVIVFLFNYYQKNIQAAPLSDFDQMVVTNGFHQISIPSGARWELSYEQNHDRVFEGVIRHISMDHETYFPIISFDILVTSGDFASPDLVSTDVSNHHFTWRSSSSTPLQGTINLLHTVPMDQATQEMLLALKKGDTVQISGWDILQIKGYDKQGKYIGYWQDSGCNTTLVTDVVVN
ncbi:MAG: hypothetical protein AB9897_08875 [Anaerolineaceae bacterium]